MLEIITFTGVGQDTGLGRLAEIAGRYPGAEFAVLAGSRTGQDDPLYPPLETIWEVQHVLPRTAVHLCGKYAREAAGEAPESGMLGSICRGFGRVQVNLPAAPRHSREERNRLYSLLRLADRVDAETVVLQHRGPWREVPTDDVRIEYLHDLSGGEGVDSIDRWPDPPRHRRAGYAGGLGPGNIVRALDFAGRHPTAHLWLDMQSGIRTPRNRLDPGLVELVCRAAFGEGRQRGGGR